MLDYFRIVNYTLIDQLDLNLSSGLTVLTGETGAGKSILMDAIVLALGGKASAELIRDKSRPCEITLSFNISNNFEAKKWLAQQAFENEEECLITRIISPEGRSRSFINNRPTTTQSLRELATLLIHLHRQHHHQNLLQSCYQRQLLDAFGDHQAVAQMIDKIYQDWKFANKNFLIQQQENKLVSEKLVMINYQLEELNQLSPQANEYQQLVKEHQQLAQAESLIATCQNSLRCLEDSDHPNVANLLNQASRSLVSHTDLNSKLNNANELINTALIHSQEAVNELNDFLEELDLNQERLQDIDIRLQNYHKLARKHHVQPEELVELQNQLSNEFAQLNHSDAELQKQQAHIDTLEKQYCETAKLLTSKRKIASKMLSKLIEEKLQALGMAGGEFAINLSPHKNEKFSRFGAEQVEFLINLNPGETLAPLKKVASGGELSRLSLAIHVVAAKETTIPTLIFDEIDVGIGGQIGAVVGQLLRELGHQAQVLCITHLPQVAAQGHHHFQLQKQITDGKTTSQIKSLEDKERIAEIARMMASNQITEKTLAHAEEMLRDLY